MRPVLIRQLVETLRRIESNGGSVNLDIASQYIGLSRQRLREVLQVLHEIQLINICENNICITEEGRTFLEAYDKRNADVLHKLLMRLRPYVLVYAHYINGVRKPQELKSLTGLNMVIVDTILRMIKEVESLRVNGGKAETSYELSDAHLSKFTREIYSTYLELSREQKNRYVTLSELRSRICRKLGLTVTEFDSLFKRFLEINRGRVTLVPAPLYAKSFDTIEIHGKKYAYIMII